jgi:protoporphyrinogen oxidase
VKIAIIGAGPAGITAGYQLAKENIEVHIYESSNSVGGLAKTVSLWEQKVDIGPHRFFSNDTRVNKLWLEVVGKDYQMVNRLTRILYGENFYNYPLKPLNALFNLGLIEASNCIISFLLQKCFFQFIRKKENTFESWVTNRFGKRLFQIFFKAYSEKLWGISCKDLDSDFAAQRIKKLSLFEAVFSAIFAGRARRHKTLVDQFAYPNGGTGMVYERMADYISKNNGTVNLNSPVENVLVENGKCIGIKTSNNIEIKYDHVVSTMPINKLSSGIKNIPKFLLKHINNLKFRNTILVFIEVDAKDLFDDNWLYIHSPEVNTGRITNFRNWIPEINQNKETTILSLEYWCNENDDLWTLNDEKIIEIAKKDLEISNLIGENKILKGHIHKISKCYPIYKTGYKKNLKPIEEYLDNIQNLSVIGRYGSFKYNNQDHSILMGILSAENISKGKDNNLWQVNTDYEYQESSRITETGLEISK